MSALELVQKRTCQGTRKDGNRCQSTAVDPRGYCFAHGRSPMEVSANALRASERSAEVRREQAKTVRGRLREKVEENVEEIWDAFNAGLKSEDERVRLVAAQAVLAEAYGRPAQAIVGDPDQPVAFILESVLARVRGDGATDGAL